MNENRMFRITDANSFYYMLEFQLLDIQGDDMILDVFGEKEKFKESMLKEITKKKFYFSVNKTNKIVDKVEAFNREEAIDIYKKKHNTKTINGIKVTKEKSKKQKRDDIKIDIEVKRLKKLLVETKQNL
ncbi:hypothetical protein [Clostridioides difficile]|uniref:hypothetical protein n=1 Tax=Clostridioides difficile TaxID=1496 RepID=UPI000D1DC50C|nr:hypothetical protein [Clostridioides difficile]HBE9444501.1 hypothetical protein [Clostridioides difficile]